MAKIVFYPRRIAYSFFLDLAAKKERVEVSVPDSKIKIVNSHTVKIDSSVLKHIGIDDRFSNAKKEWSYWHKDVDINGLEYMREVDIALTGE